MNSSQQCELEGEMSGHRESSEQELDLARERQITLSVLPTHGGQFTDHERLMGLTIAAALWRGMKPFYLDR
jgi:hypothetical protein